MRINVISDIHYQREGLSDAGRDCDLFVCLGDLILFLDYDDPSVGILADLLGPDSAKRYVELRTANRWDEARQYAAGLWGRLGGDTRALITERVHAQYRDLFAVLPDGLYTYGNVDLPDAWPSYARPGQHILDGGAVTIGGLRLGFVGGGLPSPMRTPFEIPEEQFDAKIDALGPVDLLFSHIPPAVAELTYDVVARRFERGSEGLLRYVLQRQPRYLLHGHIHQPLVPRMRIGRTEIINVGHFRRNRRPFVLNVDPLPS